LFDSDTILRVLLVVPALVLAASFHEFAHGFIADRLGDGTARGMGRLTLNPIKHLDPIGSVLVPLIGALMPGGFLFGWAKPVPVNPYNLRNPKTDMAWVAFAGPATNFMLAFSGAFFLRLLPLPTSPDGGASFILMPIIAFLQYFILINVLLGIFNLLPVPPLDGGRIVVGLLPAETAAKWAAIEPYGFMIIVVLVFLDPFGFWSNLMSPAIIKVFSLFLMIAGLK
jgi:Zn-dependent protease